MRRPFVCLDIAPTTDTAEAYFSGSRNRPVCASASIFSRFPTHNRAVLFPVCAFGLLERSASSLCVPLEEVRSLNRRPYVLAIGARRCVVRSNVPTWFRASMYFRVPSRATLRSVWPDRRLGVSLFAVFVVPSMTCMGVEWGAGRGGSLASFTAAW